MKINVAIIEDEPATARNLSALLQKAEPDINVLAVLESVTGAVDWLRKNKDDCGLLFMDIRLSDGMSFRIFDAVSFDIPVVFVTAYHEYALQAFKANGIDYILKPFDEEQVTAALQKFKKLYTSERTQTLSKETIKEVLKQIQQQPGYRRSFLVHHRDKLIPVYVNDIHWFYTINEVLHATTSTGTTHIIEGTLDKLQQELDPVQFYKANRQFIINRNAIKEVNFYFNGRLSVKIMPEPKEPVLISKARVPEFKEWMNR